ncbi:MAG: cyclic nucleotide-binding domain-containing protein [Halioglobus sp.]|nr:cyclic nucleotide-binding domain-containing protein [Halioglobus sp.]
MTAGAPETSSACMETGSVVTFVDNTESSKGESIVRVIPHMHDYISGLSPAGRETFERLSTVVSVPKGSAVYRQGDESNEIYQLLEGAVRICNFTEDGREIVTAEFQAGDCLGEMGMVDGLPRVNNAIATRDTVLRVLKKRHFDELSVQFPELKDLLLLTLCRRARAFYALHEEICLSLHQRVARTVLRLAYTHGRGKSQGKLYIVSGRK